VPPSEASIGIVADFLLSLFDEGKSVFTVRGYRTAVAAIHEGFEDGTFVSDSQALNHLIRGMFNRRPPVRRLLPPWSLESVFALIKAPPFEPLGEASLKFVTLKTIFLLALCSGRRRGALAALSADPSCLRFENHGVRLLTRPSFLAKNQRVNFLPDPIFIADISRFSSVREDRFWCPVRALRFYLKKTESFRQVGSSLFLSLNAPHSGVSPDTISRWLVQVISFDGKALSGPGTPRAHDVRALAASWAFFKGIPVSDILKAAVWKTENTFISYYLKDILREEGGFSLASLPLSGRL